MSPDPDLPALHLAHPRQALGKLALAVPRNPRQSHDLSGMDSGQRLAAPPCRGRPWRAAPRRQGAAPRAPVAAARGPSTSRPTIIRTSS